MLVVDMDCGRLCGDVAIAEVVIVLASCDMVFVRRVGEARERMLVNEQGALQDGQRPSDDGPCSHYTETSESRSNGRERGRTSVICSKQKILPQQRVREG